VGTKVSEDHVISICRVEANKMEEVAENCSLLRYYVASSGISICRVEANKMEELAENCILLHYYVASSGISVPTFRDNLSAPKFR
jgi:hypothetical protein